MLADMAATILFVEEVSNNKGFIKSVSVCLPWSSDKAYSEFVSQRLAGENTAGSHKDDAKGQCLIGSVDYT